MKTQILSILLVALLFSFHSAVSVGQTTGDELFHAVIRLQWELGDGDDGNQLRDAWDLRALEIEASRGASANAMVLNNALRRLRSVPHDSADYEEVIRKLETHLVYLQNPNAQGVLDAIGQFESTLPELTAESLDQSRQDLVYRLDDLAAYHESELSYYGRHYLDGRLGLEELRKTLAEFEFEAQERDTKQFAKDIIGLRKRIAEAETTFAKATLSYQHHQLRECERSLAAMKRQLLAFVTPMSKAATAALKADLERRLLHFRNESGTLNDPRSRGFQAELGRWLALLADRKQMSSFDRAVRQLYSLPNFKVTIREGMINRLASQTVSEVAYIDEVILGTRAQGLSYTNGDVVIDFVPNPVSAQVRVRLSGTVASDQYTQEWPVMAYTGAYGSLHASRDVAVNVGSMTVFNPVATASVSSEFRGTDSIRLIERIALKRYLEIRERSDQIASERARDQLLDRFTKQTDEPLKEGQQKLNELRERRGELFEELSGLRDQFSVALARDEDGRLEKSYPMVDPLVLPRISTTTTDDALQVTGTLEAHNRLAASSFPAPATFPVDIRVQVHETLFSNMAAPLIQGKLIHNWQFADIADSFSSGAVEVPDPGDGRKFAIRFMEGRPIQIEFEDNQVVVKLIGKEFQQGGNRYPTPMYIAFKFRVIRHDGKLKLVRAGEPVADFLLPQPEGGYPADDIAIRQSLRDNLAALSEEDPIETAVELPENLLPTSYVREAEVQQQLERLQLVEFSTQDGWLNIGWNYSPGPVFTVDTPAIWPGLPAELPAEPAEVESAPQ